MKIVVNGLLCLLLFVVGVRIGLILLRRGVTANDLFKSKTPLSLIFLGAYVAVMVALLHVPQLGIWPMEWRVYGLQATWTMMRAVLLGICGVAIAISWKTARTQMVAIILIGGVGISSFAGMEQYLLAPIHSSLSQDMRPYGIVKQTSNSSCAPAALATILNQWGIQTSEPEVAELARTSRLGTSMPQLILAAQKLGMDGLELHPSWETIRRINRPGVLSIWLLDGYRRLPHAVALLGMNRNTAIIADPAVGKVFRVDQDALDSVWRGEYVPIFRPQDMLLSQTEAKRYLSQLGYEIADTHANLGEEQNPRNLDQEFQATLRLFQKENPGLSRSGKLDPETVLALTGAFLPDGPTLSLPIGDSPRTIADYHQTDRGV